MKPIIKNKNKPLISSNSNKFQLFKKGLGLVFVAFALYASFSLISIGISALSGEVNFMENDLVKRLIPSSLEERSLTFSTPTSEGNYQKTTIEMPKYFLLISAIFVTIFIFGLIVRLVVALLNAGIALMRDDASYIFEQLRKELENKNLDNDHQNLTDR